jgi:hypothetical protein
MYSILLNKSDILKPRVSLEISASPQGLALAFISTCYYSVVFVATAALSFRGCTSASLIASISTLVKSPTGFISTVLTFLSLFLAAILTLSHY